MPQSKIFLAEMQLVASFLLAVYAHRVLIEKILLEIEHVSLNFFFIWRWGKKINVKVFMYNASNNWISKGQWINLNDHWKLKHVESLAFHIV